MVGRPQAETRHQSPSHSLLPPSRMEKRIGRAKVRKLTGEGNDSLISKAKRKKINQNKQTNAIKTNKQI